MASVPAFTAGGLASGLDTNTIVDKLVALESQPITKNTAKQAALNVQISAVADLVSKIKSLSTSASTLASGIAAYSIAAAPSGVSAVAGSGATGGRYSITVDSVASTAKARSIQFSSANDKVAGGTLSLHVQGVAVSIAITANSDLGSVARQINQANKGVAASVVSDGTHFYIAMSNRETGKPIGSAANGGLTVDSDTTGSGLAVTVNATNARLSVDGLAVESLSNDIQTAVPGVTLTVKSQQLVAGDLVIAGDSTKSAANIQGFIDTFNSILGVLKQSLRPDPDSPPADGTVLDGSIAMGMQQRLQSLMSSIVSQNGTVRTLGDIGVKLQNDGTLKLDTAVFNKAVAKDPGAVDAIFSTATTGINAKIAVLNTSFTDPVNGQLIQRTKSLKNVIKNLDTSNARLQAYVANYKIQLQRQFATMENLVSGYNTIGTFLTNSPAFSVNNGSK
jgi:flagellar hook-associated protein 2